jgi:hypothetical protein
MSTIHDGGIDRKMTAEEIAIAEATKAAALLTAEAEAVALAAKSVERQAVLDRLGLTAEEAQLLLGGI